MIDQRYQKNGFGREAIRFLIEHLKTSTNIANIIISCHQGNGNPSGFYRKMGFTEADEEIKRNDLGRRIKDSEDVFWNLYRMVLAVSFPKPFLLNIGQGVVNC